MAWTAARPGWRAGAPALNRGRPLLSLRGTMTPPPLRLASVEAFPLALPLRKPMRLASEIIATAQTLLVRAVDQDGREGWGEASVAPTMTGELLPGMVAAVEGFLAPALVAAPVADAAGATHRIARAIRANTGAKSAAECAVLDLLAQRAGVPLHALLGGRRHDRAPAILMLGEKEPDATLAALHAGLASGMAHFKVKVGLASGMAHFKVKVGLASAPEADAALCARLRAAIGPGRHLAADANMAWTAAQAIRFLRAMPDGTLDYLEQPVADDDLPAMAEAAAATSCPICVDEGLHAAADIVAHAKAGAAQGVGLKAIKLGGLRATVAADALARAQGMRTTLACKIAESSIGAAGILHACAVLPDLGWGVSLTHAYLAEDSVAAPIPITRGEAMVPAGPGLGVAPDPGRLARFCARP